MDGVENRSGFTHFESLFHEAAQSEIITGGLSREYGRTETLKKTSEPSRKHGKIKTRNQNQVEWILSLLDAFSILTAG
jgi:hypothetical protein